MLRKILHQPSNEERVREWTRTLRKEQRKVNIQIAQVKRDELRIKQTMKRAAAKGDRVAVRMLARELVRSHKAVNRMYTMTSQMNSVCMQLQNQAAQIRIIGSMASSREIMQEMNRLVKLRDVRETMQTLSQEMMKSGLIEEMVNDNIDDALDENISDSELEEEVNKVVEDAMMNKMQGANVNLSALPAQAKVKDADKSESEDEELNARLAALRSS